MVNIIAETLSASHWYQKQSETTHALKNRQQPDFWFDNITEPYRTIPQTKTSLKPTGRWDNIQTPSD